MKSFFRKQSGGKTEYIEVSIPPGETQLGNWTGSLRAGGISAIGVQIILTDRHLFLTPLDLSKAVALLETFAKYVDTLGKPVQLAKDVIDHTGAQEVVSIPLDEIRSVEPLGGPSLLRPPAIGVTLKDGSHATIGVLKSITSPNPLPENARYRDELLNELRAIIGRQ